MGISAIALQGVQQAEAQLNEAASNIASAGAASTAANGDSVDLSAEMIALMPAQNQSSVSLSTLKIADELQQSLINIMA
jgi:hypothetical protein